MGGDEELAGAGVGEFVALEFAANVLGVFGAEVVVGGAVAVGSLDNNPLFGRGVGGREERGHFECEGWIWKHCKTLALVRFRILLFRPPPPIELK